jgi:hypothetical protein
MGMNVYDGTVQRVWLSLVRTAPFTGRIAAHPRFSLRPHQQLVAILISEYLNHGSCAFFVAKLASVYKSLLPSVYITAR